MPRPTFAPLREDYGGQVTQLLLRHVSSFFTSQAPVAQMDRATAF